MRIKNLLAALAGVVSFGAATAPPPVIDFCNFSGKYPKKQNKLSQKAKRKRQRQK